MKSVRVGEEVGQLLDVYTWCLSVHAQWNIMVGWVSHLVWVVDGCRHIRTDENY